MFGFGFTNPIDTMHCPDGTVKEQYSSEDEEVEELEEVVVGVLFNPPLPPQLFVSPLSAIADL